MISNAAKRSILRWTHLVFTIPVLGYVYGRPSEVEQYAAAARLVFIPVIVFTGYWMYGGLIFAMIGVGAWLGVYHFWGYGAVVLSQVAILIARKIWLMIRARRLK